MPTFRLTPKAVRRLLGLKAGDKLRYVIDQDRIVIEKEARKTQGDQFAEFTEWSSEADEDAYKSL